MLDLPVSPLIKAVLVAFSAWTLIHVVTYIRSDYAFFLSLGPGGTPKTPSGYLKICLLGLISRSKRDVLIPPTPLAASFSRPYFKTPDALPLRKERRPIVGGLAPHRQLTQRGNAADVDALTACLKDMRKANPNLLSEGRSCFEKHSLALFLAPTQQSREAVAIHSAQFAAKPPTGISSLSSPSSACLPSAASSVPTNSEAVRNTTCGAPPEIAHMHGIDGSLHLTLGAEDAGVVIRRGWGERHPLAGRWLPRGFVMVYAPRNQEELKIMREIIKASAMWVGGVELD